MTITIEQIRSYLDSEEPNYEAATGLGKEALPLLAELAGGSDTLLAAKATHLASLIGADGTAVDVIAIAAKSRTASVRAAAAAAINNVAISADVTRVLSKLLTDRDPGVRKYSIQAVNLSESPKLKAKLEKIAGNDAEHSLRGLAGDVIRKHKG